MHLHLIDSAFTTFGCETQAIIVKFNNVNFDEKKVYNRIIHNFIEQLLL